MEKQRENTAPLARRARRWMAWDLRRLRSRLGLSQKRMATRLGMSKSHYEILESPRDFVPEPLPLPEAVRERLAAIERELLTRGQLKKMPSAHCPLHNARLARAREAWLWRLRGKRKRWWAVCPIGEELYTVRSDGHVQIAPRWKPKNPSRARRGRGRPAVRRALFIKAAALRSKGHKLPDIARVLVPQEFKEDPARATERLRIGILNLKKKRPKTSLPERG